METFLTLREFLSLKRVGREWESAISQDPFPRSRRDGYHTFADDLLERYDVARASWERFGDAGPPAESTVQTLREGFGGSVGEYRIFCGVYEPDPRFFKITRMDPKGCNVVCDSLVSIVHWWLDIRVIDEENDQ